MFGLASKAYHRAALCADPLDAPRMTSNQFASSLGNVAAPSPSSSCIITVSSQMGHVGGPKRTLYCASKHAVEGMTKALAWELGGHNIRVNTLCPTYIETPLTAPMLSSASTSACR